MDKQTFKEQVETAIQYNFNTYKDPSRFVIDYGAENAIKKEYNGRELLELLQNADDAQSTYVEIILNTGLQQLVITNSGQGTEPFSAAGIKSLMIPYNSSKTSSKFIGNKGLGFRAILNWAQSIHIYTLGWKVSFSERLAQKNLEKLGLSHTEIEALNASKGYNKNPILFPVLAIPKMEVDSQPSEQTRIEIFYKKEPKQEIEKSIKQQLNQLKPEILLFLKHLQVVSIRVDDDKLIQLKRTSIQNEQEGIYNYDSIDIQNKIWKVFKKEGILPQHLQPKDKIEQSPYQVKVAFLADGTDYSNESLKLFNFFPTKHEIYLPCILHGTFELNSSRNNLDDKSKVNEFILEQLVSLLADCATYLKTKQVDWKPYQLLTPKSNNSDSDLIKAFYKDLETEREKRAIYPCIDAQYRLLSETFYYNDDFNDFFSTHFPQTLPNLLMMLKGFNKPRPYPRTELVKKINELSKTNLDIDLRAALILKLADVLKDSNEKGGFELLVNEENQVISSQITAFMILTENENKFKISASVKEKIDFISKALCEKLKNNTEPKVLKKTIDKVVDIEEYDGFEVSRKIISITNRLVDNCSELTQQQNYIREMVSSLYANGNFGSNLDDNKVMLIAATGKIVKAKDLFLSETYPTGCLTKMIYNNHLDENEYLIDINDWQLGDEDPNRIEQFFIWLGVNRLAKFKNKDIRILLSENEYRDAVFKCTEKPNEFRWDRVRQNCYVKEIDNFDKIKLLKLEHILLILLRNLEAKEREVIGQTIPIEWFYLKWQSKIMNPLSYTRYQFLKANIFNNYIVKDGSDDLNKLINPSFPIDYKLLDEYGISKTEANAMILKLGGKESFDTISVKTVYKILQKLPTEVSDGKNTQKIYRMALERLSRQNVTPNIPADLKFFARKGKDEGYQPYADVYYATNATLPKKILDERWLLNLPKRSSEANIIKYFGVKGLEKIEFQLVNIENQVYNDEFQVFFDQLKPFLLTYRLKNVTTQADKKHEANLLKKAKIHIVKRCDYKEKDLETTLSIGEGEFMKVEDPFYFKTTNLTNEKMLIKDSHFGDSFAEMICILFKVNDLGVIARQILRNDRDDTAHSIRQDPDLGEDLLNEASELLGATGVEIDFWKRIFQEKGKLWVENVKDLKTTIQDELIISLPNDYSKVNFDTFENQSSIDFIECLSQQLSLFVKQMVPKGLALWHRYRFGQVKMDLKNAFNQCLWSKLRDMPNEQRFFIKYLSEYDNVFEQVIEEESCHKMYELKLEYATFMKGFIQKKYDFYLGNLQEPFMKITSQYLDIQEDKAKSDEIRSLFYFKGNRKKIEEAITPKITVDHDEIALAQTETQEIRGEMKHANLVAIKTDSNADIEMKGRNGTTRKVRSYTNSIWLHSSAEDEGKKEQGREAELLVLNELVEKYGAENVEHSSGYSTTTPDKSDSKGYDIRYKADTDWKYLEVKSVSNLREFQFIISGREVETGKANADNYELAFVDLGSKKIRIVSNFFKLEGNETFEHNGKFTVSPKDYIISCRLE